jgi:hypothetical protein
MHRTYRFEGSRDEARDRVDAAMSHQAARHPRFHPTYEWIGPYRARARFHVPLIRGEQEVELVVHNGRIEVRSRLPRLLRVFRARIFNVLDRHALVTLDGMLRGAE